MNDYVPDHPPAAPRDVLSFWFSEESRPKWFVTDPSFDAVVSTAEEDLYLAQGQDL